MQARPDGLIEHGPLSEWRSLAAAAVAWGGDRSGPLLSSLGARLREAGQVSAAQLCLIGANDFEALAASWVDHCSTTDAVRRLMCASRAFGVDKAAHASLLAYYGGHTADATRLAAIELILRTGLVLALFSRAQVQAPVLAALLAQVAVLLVAFRRLEARVLGVPVSRLFDACVKPAALTGAVTSSLMVAFRATGGGSVQGRVAALAFGTVAALGLLVLQERDLGRSFLRRRVA